MALEFICDNALEHGEKIVLSRCANSYKLDFSKNKIIFYQDNPGDKCLELNTWKIPLNAREMEFEFRSDRIGGYIVFSRFYDVRGNLLKIGNR